jgi:hypothetical protein
MAKLDRERRVRMRRHAKQLKKDAKKLAPDMPGGILGEQTDMYGEPLDGALDGGPDGADVEVFRDALGRTEADRIAASESGALDVPPTDEADHAPDGTASPVG